LLGEEVLLPETNAPLFARMEIAPTFLGKLRAALFKPPFLSIVVQLRTGKSVKYRLNSNMARTDFLISPLVHNTEEFALLAAAGTRYLGSDQVKSVQVVSEDRQGRYWKPQYSLELSTPALAQDTPVEAALLFDQVSDPPGELSDASNLRCDGMIETVNGTPWRSGIAPVSNVLSIDGWMTVAGKDGVVPDSVFVTLTADGGKTTYVKAHTTRRDDIKLHFNRPDMPDPGYAALIDTAPLHGQYTLGLARAYRGRLGICEQFKSRFLIER
jgi:hypothetical protein